MNEAALGNFYTMLADASPIPVMIYNMPGNSGVNVPSSLTLKLAAHPNITGIKDSGGNIVQISEVLAKAPEGFSVFAGSGSYLLATLLLGGVGGTLAVANVVPDYCAEIQENFEKGDLEKARKMQLALLPLNAAVTSRFGIGGMKAAMDMVGFKGGLPACPSFPPERRRGKKSPGSSRSWGSPRFSPMIISPDRFLADVEDLGRIGWVDGEGMDRPAFSPSYGIARKFVEDRMKDAGLAVTVDGVGNIFGTLDGSDPSLPAIYAGSHLDAVPGGGKYDGPLGVMAALEAARTIRKRASPCGIPLWSAGFTGEEGGEMGGTFGSRAFAGLLEEPCRPKSWPGWG